MAEVLGVSVGASAVRMARPDLRLHTSGERELDFHNDTVDAHFDRAEEVAAESIGVVLSQSNGDRYVEATGVAYRDQQQFGDIQQAMMEQRLYNYRLVPEARAALAYLEATGEIGNFSTIALYDLGSSGLTITVVDRASGDVLLAERTTDISGSDFDRLICDNQLAKQGVDLDNAVGIAEFTTRCRIAKEQLSTSGAVCLPGDSGVILISRESFEALVTVPIEYSARLVRDVITRSPQRVDALFLVGGGARIPLVEAILRSWTGLPVVAPADPEAVAAKGAALLATPVNNVPPPNNPARTAHSSSNGGATALTGAPEWLSPEPVDRSVTSKRKIRGAALVAGGLAAVAALGLTLGYGGSEDSTSAPADNEQPLTSAAPSTTRSAPTTTVTTPPPVTTTVAPAPVEPAPVETYEEPQYEEPAPAPPPAPAPLIPGLPQFQLPQIQLPPPPVFQLPRF
ncbi:Hsp70 family protein [Rhodococcus sp. G-MC3]|uniref:Hsp70 family protein n=1 Tax=Rhodococcus sp. G-MC3 TaxID=3046209 RepID=UPI0024BA7908|nr:Hsp70 family protein [Rhodococcus sp. G-MC3]MDJ0395261.1 Hsp70 family protein [Rhodococcus sp. G-MC3]